MTGIVLALVGLTTGDSGRGMGAATAPAVHLITGQWEGHYFLSGALCGRAWFEGGRLYLESNPPLCAVLPMTLWGAGARGEARWKAEPDGRECGGDYRLSGGALRIRLRRPERVGWDLGAYRTADIELRRVAPPVGPAAPKPRPLPPPPPPGPGLLPPPGGP